MYLLGVPIQPIADGHLIQAGFIDGHQTHFVERASIKIKTVWKKAGPNDAAIGEKKGKERRYSKR